MVQKRKNRKIALYMVGGIALAVGTAIVAPKVIDYLSDQFYKEPSVSEDDDDWGPEIVKKSKEEDDADGEL